jgi:hypothetical protein
MAQISPASAENERPVRKMTEPKAKRRWFQFSLRTLLVFVTFCAICCSWFAVKMQQARQQRVAVAAILKLGGSVDRPELSKPAWLRNLLGNDLFSNVQAANFFGTQVTDADLENLKSLTQLRFLNLERTQVTDTGLENLKGLNELEELNLVETKITDAGLEKLEGLSQLHVLCLGDTQVTDAGLEHLKGLSELQELQLFDTQITDAGLEKLTILKQLRSLPLERTKVTDAGVNKLRQELPNCLIVNGP